MGMKGRVPLPQFPLQQLLGLVAVTAPEGLGEGTWWDPNLTPIPAITRSRWLWRWPYLPASSSPSCSLCSTSAGAGPSSALTVSPPHLARHRGGFEPWHRDTLVPASVGWLGLCWVPELGHGCGVMVPVGWGPWVGTVEGCRVPPRPQQHGQQLLIHSWNGFSL